GSNSAVKETDDIYHKGLILTALLLAAAIVISALFWVYINRKIAKPIIHMRQAANEIAGGDLSNDI
ncbi:methyl-accepting chemotaxis protein, partial [Bacillus atrophaeus]|nr:methyl-accepting chemotaxis protein [Bacillus atrophaeus]